MNQKALLLIVVTLLAGAIGTFLWLSGGDDNGPLLAPQELGTTDAAPATAQAGPNPAAAVEASAPVDAGATARDAVADVAGKRPIPDGSTWITLTVVDAASNAPVPAATVFWHDEKARELLSGKRLGNQWDPEQQQMWRTPEVIAERAGWQTRCDDKGQARVTLRDFTMVAAVHEGKYGLLQLRKNTVAPSGGYRVLLKKDSSLPVRVVDDADQPCARVPINVLPYGKDQQQLGNYRWMTLATTGADGTATVPHLEQLLKQAQDEQIELTGATWHVRPVLPGDDQRGVAITLDHPPTEPVLLRLGPCGSIKVRATNNGKPLPTFTQAALQEDRSGKPDGNNGVMPRLAPVDADGWARFLQVPLGCRFQAMDTSGNLRTTTTGPVARGQEVEVVLRVADDALSITGRIVDRERAPIAEQTFTVQARGPNLRNWMECRTDADGRFLVSLGKPRKDNRVDELSFQLQTEEHEQPLRAELSPRTLRPGVEDVGDVMLGEGPLLVAGRLVAGDAAYTRPLNLGVEHQEAATGNKPPRWRGLDKLLVYLDGKGGFKVTGTPGNGRHRLAIHPHEALPLTPIEFQIGAKDLEVRIDPGAPLAASVLLPERTDGDNLSAVLVPTKLADPQQKPGAGPLTALPDNGQQERYDLQWAAVPLGTYALELRLRTRIEPLLRLEAIELPGPAGGDPRLVDIDLRGQVRKLTLRLLGAEGKQLEEANGMLFVGGQAEGTEWTGQQFWGATVVALVPSGQFDLLLCCQGFRPQPIRSANIGDSLDVRLEPWPTVAVTFQNLPQLPKDTDVTVRLVPTAGPTGKVKNQWGSNDRSDYMAANGSATLEEGRCRVAIGDGPHRLRVTVQVNRRSHEFTDITPTQVLATDANVVVQISEAQWQLALTAITAPPK